MAKYTIGEENGNSITYTKIEPSEDMNGYLVVEKQHLLRLPQEAVKTLKDGSQVEGEWLHRMVVFTYGDCNGNHCSYPKVIDHLNMNKKDNSVKNLEVVSYGINLYRAMVKTNGTGKDICTDRYKKYFNSLDDAGRHELIAEIVVDKLKNGR